VQNWLGQKLTHSLAKDLHTTIKVDKVNFSLFNKLHLEGLLVEDQQKDTLLYAGDFSIRITDWFFLKDNIQLNYIGLENAVVKMQRDDSIWRHQFLLDYFNQPASSTAKKSGKNLQLDLKKIYLHNVKFLQQDNWKGSAIKASIKVMNVDANHLTLSDNIYDIATLKMESPVVSFSHFTGKTTNSSISKKSNSTDNFSESGKNLFRIAELEIKDGKFSHDIINNEATLSYFDPSHIQLSNINAKIENSIIAGDTIKSHLKISATERCGLQLKDFTANLKATPKSLELSNLKIATNKSLIQRSIALDYASFRDWNHFVQRVKINADFNNSIISSDDIAYFAPALKDWKKNITLKGLFTGTIDNLSCNTLEITAGNETYLKGDIKIKGLPSIDNAYFDFAASDLSSNYEDAQIIFPSIREFKSPDLKKLRYLRFKGNFAGTINDFITNGSFQTGLGTINSDLTFSTKNSKTPTYKGSLSLEKFELGKLLGDEELGPLTFKGTVNGSGLNNDERDVKFDGLVSQASYKNYSYNDIKMQGVLSNKRATASIKVDNDNLQIDSLVATIDFSNTNKPYFLVKGSIARANLKDLHLSKKDISFGGNVNLQMQGDNIETIVGNFKTTDAFLSLNGELLPVDSLSLSIENNDGDKSVKLVSNEISASANGNFKIGELQKTVQQLLHRYYPQYISAPIGTVSKQKVKFHIQTYYAEPLVQLFTSQLKGFNNTELSGEVNTIDNILKLNATLPQLAFKQYKFENLSLTALGKADSLLVNAETNSIQLNDSLKLPAFQLQWRARNDSSNLSVKSGSNATIQSVNLQAQILSFADGIEVNVNPSDFTINGKSWIISDQGQVTLRKNKPVQGQLKLSEGDQSISIRSVKPKSESDPGKFEVALQNLNISDFAPYFLPHNRLEGLISGNITIDDPVGTLVINSEDIKTKLLRFDNDSIGELSSTLHYNNHTRELTAVGGTNNKENALGFNVRLDLSDSVNLSKNKIALKAKTYPIKVLENFIGNLFADMNGYLTGDVDITGDLRYPAVTGKGRLKDAGLRIKYTQCYYKIEDKDIELTNSLIDLNGLVLRDTVTGNPIYVSGGIEHEAFSHMFYNLNISTQKPATIDPNYNKPVQLLKTTKQDNSIFFGDVKGTGSLKLYGPQAELVMTLKAVASEKDSSYVTLPAESTRENGIADFLIEKKYGQEMEASSGSGSADNFIYDIEMTANPKVTVKVIMDDLSGDEIKGRGTGTLKLRSGTTENTTLRGRFNIDEGNYLFTFQSFFKKPFEIRKGAGNYIEWTGDPYDANIKFEAIYKADRVSFAPLASTLNLTSDVSNARSEVQVIAKLTDKLFKPKIAFSLDFPSNSVAKTNPELALLIKQLENNPNEINRQVTYLIVFNSFAPGQLAGDMSASKVGVNTISGILLSVVSDQINRLFTSLLKSDKYQINFNTSLYNRNIISSSSTALNLGSNVNFSIGRSFFNNRFLISTGLGMDAPLGQATQSSVQQSILLLPDVTMEWLMNPSGTIRASFFYRTNADYLSGSTSASAVRSRRAGTSLSFKKEFEKLSDLFKPKNRKKD
jgi:hypothetical protein